MVHPEVQKVIDYPNTKGKQAALEHYNWNKLDKVEEVMVASRVITLAKLFDSKCKL